MFGPVSDADLRAAQILTGAAMALWLGIRYVPGLQQHAVRAQVAVLLLYLVGCVVVLAHALLR
ncbi:MAG TPA: hypothetical protein VFN42_09690 [Acetobacteraceae bacterium]|nr:hypothetical protein [Acetobacteraceae bacterium]